jgi:uncharacterized protein
MGKIALMFIVVIAALIWFRFNASRQARRDERAAPPPPPGGAPERMVACAGCGLHLPANEAVTDGTGRVFCGIAHRDAARR